MITQQEPSYAELVRGTQSYGLKQLQPLQAGQSVADEIEWATPYQHQLVRIKDQQVNSLGVLCWAAALAVLLLAIGKPGLPQWAGPVLLSTVGIIDYIMAVRRMRKAKIEEVKRKMLSATSRV